MGLCMAVGIPVAVGFLLQFIVEFAIVFPLLRIFVFNEKDMKDEQDANKLDSINNFYKVREETEEVLTLKSGLKLHFYRYSDSTFFTVLRFRYGENNDRKKEQTRLFFELLQSRLGVLHFETKVFVTDEIYEESEEYENLRQNMSGSRIPQTPEYNKARLMAQRYMQKIVDGTKRGGVLCTTVYIRNQSSMYAEDLVSTVTILEKALLSQETGIRSMESLDKEALRRFYVQYFNIGAFNVKTMRPADLAKGLMSQYRNKIQVYEVKTVKGDSVGDKSKRELNNRFGTKSKTIGCVREEKEPEKEDFEIQF